MKKKLIKSKKKKGTAFSLKDKILISLSVFAITTCLTAIASKAAVSLNSYSNPSPLLVPDVTVTDVNQTDPGSDPVLTDETALTLEEACARLDKVKGVCCSVIDQEYPYKSGKYRRVCDCNKCSDFNMGEY